MFIVKETDTIRVQARSEPSPTQQRVLLSFTGIGHRMGGMDEQRPEFFTAGNAFDNILFISDLTRSWGNAFDLSAELAELAPYLEGREIFALGNSLGAFLAILACRHVPITTCAAFVPQFSVHPDEIEEDRWQDYTSAITDWRIRSLEGQFNDTTRYCILSAGVPKDRRHWERFPAQPNIIHVVPRPSNHGLAQSLKEDGVLTDVLSGIWDGRFSADWLGLTTGRKVQILSPKVEASTPQPAPDPALPPQKPFWKRLLGR